MSRSYRISVRECINKVIRAQDRVSTNLEILEVLPPEQMAGALGRVASYYRTHGPEIATQVLESRKRAGSIAARSAGELDASLVDSILQAVSSSYDAEFGGFGVAPKFPQTEAILLLLEQAQLRSDKELRQMALHTLERMAGGGMYDHVEGGWRFALQHRLLGPSPARLFVAQCHRLDAADQVGERGVK